MKVAKKVFSVSLAVSLLVGLGLLSFNSRAVADWWILRDYQPSAEVAQIADKITMTEEARRVFYVYDPQIEDSASFNQHCTVAEVSIVLGCYNGSNIYVFRVEDERLAGVLEVTAAHEMLHAAYDRLSDEERERVDELTQRQFQKISDERLRGTIQSYRARDASVVPNELHSILATEVRNLDPELEDYYRQYFVDRLQVVGISESYEQIFSDIKTKVERLDAELTLLKAQIDSLEADLGTRADAISRDRAELNRLYDQENPSAYNSMVPSYNASVQSYNLDLATYRSLITEYNAKVAVRNQTTIEQNNLIDSLSSKASDL